VWLSGQRCRLLAQNLSHPVFLMPTIEPVVIAWQAVTVLWGPVHHNCGVHHMLESLLSSEAFWFWVIVVAMSALVVWFTEQGVLLAALSSLFALAVGIAFFPSQWDMLGLGGLREQGLWSWLGDNILSVLVAVVLYLLIGLVWSTLRWWMHVRSIREEYEDRRVHWLSPGTLQRNADLFHSRAKVTSDESIRDQYSAWRDLCARAAELGGNRLTPELKPLWKVYVENGYQF
jgi:hypothetical protein